MRNLLRLRTALLAMGLTAIAASARGQSLERRPVRRWNLIVTHWGYGGPLRLAALTRFPERGMPFLWRMPLREKSTTGRIAKFAQAFFGPVPVGVLGPLQVRLELFLE